MDDLRDDPCCRHGNTVKDSDGAIVACGSYENGEILLCGECLEDQAEAEGQRWADEGEPEYPRFGG